MTIFTIKNLTHSFGGLRAVADFGLEMQAGELVGLIGPNGAGKTTVFNLVSGIYKPSSGRIFFENFDITGLAPHAISRLGIARTFQNIRLFHDMSAIDNVSVRRTDERFSVDRCILPGYGQCEQSGFSFWTGREV